MLASPGAPGRESSVPDKPGWQHEIKWDGVRLLADVRDGKVTLVTRSERDVTAGFPEFAALADVAPDALFDGEAIAWLNGVPVFSRVVDRVHVGNDERGQASAARHAALRPATFMVFDLLRLDGLDIMSLPLRARRRALESIWSPGPARSLSTTYADGPALWTASAEQGLEGVVSKRLDSPYRSGTRSKDWLKFPHRGCDSYVIGGWRPQVGSTALGALLVGSPMSTHDGGLAFRGRVGSGLAGRSGARLAQALAPLARLHSPFTGDVPDIDARGTTWVEPVLVVDVASLGVTASPRLRQASYQRLRSDLDPKQVPYADR